ncbi:MAG: hypothetical protein JG777_868 [Clostridia bacterium]|nr:hypothetical protein [Clostridia bacterium]
MKKTIRDIELIKQKILMNYKVIKQVNFDNDIDLEKSGSFIIHPVENYLEFLYQPVEKISINECISVLGEIEINNEGVIFKPTVNPKSLQYSYPRKEAICLVRIPINPNEVDIIDISFTCNMTSYFYMMLVNRFGFETMLKVIEGKASHRDVVRSQGSRATQIQCINNEMSVYYMIGEDVTENIVSVPVISNSIEYMFNINKTYITYKLANKNFMQNINLHRKLPIDSNSYYIYFGVDNYNINSPTTKEACLHKVVYGQEHGYIYLRPINICSKMIQVIMLYCGNSVVQFFCPDKKQWLEVKDKEIIKNSTGSVSFRVYMHSRDKIYEFAIIEI